MTAELQEHCCKLIQISVRSRQLVHNVGVGVQFNAPPDASRHWYWQRKQYRKIHKLNTIQKSNKKYSKTKLNCFSRFLWHSAGKQGGLILQGSQAHKLRKWIYTANIRTGIHSNTAIPRLCCWEQQRLTILGKIFSNFSHLLLKAEIKYAICLVQYWSTTTELCFSTAWFQVRDQNLWLH